jgi:outer membrane lipoprotein-sorting protein
MKRLKHDERGVAHLLIVAGIGVTAWRVASKSKPVVLTASGSSTKTSAATTSSASDSSCLAIYHDANICNFATNSNDFTKTAYTASITATQSGTSSTMTLKNDGKGDTDLKGTSNGQTFESITIGATTYIQENGTGSWIEYPSGTTTPTTNPTNSMDIGVGNSGITFKSEGTAACGSLTCYKYQVVDSNTPTATQYVYFDKSAYKLRGWQYTDGSGNTSDMTVTYGSVNIATPSPVESLSAAE